MDDEILFLYDELASEREKLIKELIHELNKKPFKHFKEARFLKNYITALVLASKKQSFTFKHIPISEIEQPIQQKTSIQPRLQSRLEIPKKEFKPMQKPMQIAHKKPISVPVSVAKYSKIDLPEPPKPSFYQETIIRQSPNAIIENYIYKVPQESLDPSSTKVLETLETRIDTQEKLKNFENIFKKTVSTLNIKDKQVAKEKIKEFLYNNLLGFGKINILLRDPNVKEIHCNGLNIPLTIIHSQYGGIKTDLVLTDHFELNRLITNIAKMAGFLIDENNPIAEGTLSSGEHFKLTLGTHISNASFSIYR